MHSTIDSTAHSRVTSIHLNSLEHKPICICTNSMTNLPPIRDANPVLLRFEATTEPHEPSGLEILYCQQLASPTVCVLTRTHNRDTSLYIPLPGPLRSPAGTLPMCWRCPPDIPYTLRPPAGSRDRYLRATGGPR